MSGNSGSVGGVSGKVVVVAVKVSKDISKTGLVWALTHVVQPGDTIKLLVVIPAHSSKKMWDLSRLTSDCTNGSWRSLSGTRLDQRDDISDLCSEMLLQLRDVYDPKKVKIRVKVVSGLPCGVVATEVKNAQSNWVILDKHLKHEKKSCLEDLECNVVVMKRSRPKILRLNLIGSSQTEHDTSLPLSFDMGASFRDLESKFDLPRGPFVTPASSPEHELSLTGTDIGTSSISSSDPGASPFILPGSFWNQGKEHPFNSEEIQSLYDSESDTGIERMVSSSIPSSAKLYLQPWMDDILCSSGDMKENLAKGLPKSGDLGFTSAYKGFLESLSKLDLEPETVSLNDGVDVSLRKSETVSLNDGVDVSLRKSVREAISYSSNAPSSAPPLCSLCQHKSPAFGHPPKWFTYAELELATDGFSQENFLAEGGFGSVHRGVLQDGLVVAVKQHKLASSQGDGEFCSEVEVLSCAQHRNVVMLIGLCVEDGRRLLVYEYICNGSLDLHLFGYDRDPLEWSARQKIAVGAARGLRYLHEECRVGCIVHRDMRPNNILITHDFEPLVGDFGLARWQPKGDMGVETRILGTFGYLAPEYAQSGQITEKADVYSFGVILVELLTGRKAIDIHRPKGQQCLTEWARPLLENDGIHELVDPRLRNCYSEQEVLNMMQCASLCIRRDPHYRPRMSQVLRMLEGYIVADSNNNK